MDTGIQNIPENQEILYLSTFKDKHYLSVLTVLGLIAFLCFLALIFCFSSKHWVFGIIFSVIVTVLTFVVSFCAKRRSSSIKEERNKQKEVKNEEKI